MPARRASKKQKLLTELAGAYLAARAANEDFVWEAYGDKLREKVLTTARVNVPPSAADRHAVEKYEKQIYLATLRLHEEVQTFALDEQSYSPP